MRFPTVLLLASLFALAQEPGELRTRQLWNEKFLQQRPAAKRPAAPAPTPKPSQSVPKAQPQEDLGDGLVGITLWRLRPSRPADDSRVRVTVNDQQWTPERIEASTPLAEGQMVRVGIETARKGFLYVIDREQYADGALGAPTLIFPTLRTQAGRNDVLAGRLIEIPGWTDQPSYFTLRLNRPDQTAELLTVLVAPEPIPEIAVGKEPVKLTPQQVEGWEKKWGANVRRIEAAGQAGKPYTPVEKEAATTRTRLLTHEEPLPQTMYYCDAKPGDPLLVSLPLRIGK